MTTTRYNALDVLRGLAILGTLGTNIWIFTNAEGFVGYINGAGRAKGGWRPVQEVLEQLAQGKFLGLLTIMFGIGLAVQQRSAARKGERWPGAYPWRAGLLMVDGLLHYFLVTEFDVLTGYAVTGLIVAFVLASSIRVQKIWIACAAGIHATMLALVVAALAWAPAPESQAQTSNPYADGSFWDLVVYRVENLAVFRLEVVFILPMSIALFLVGARLFGDGILDPGRDAFRRKLMIFGFGIALPLDFVVGIFGSDAGLVLGRYGIAPFVSLGLLAAVAQRYVGGAQPGVVGRAMTPVGRMALTCYVVQNILCSVVCYGWGFGLSARLDGQSVVPATIALFIAISATMIAGASLWLRRFDRGPLEWLWNVSYLRLSGKKTTRAAVPVS